MGLPRPLLKRSQELARPFLQARQAIAWPRLFWVLGCMGVLIGVEVFAPPDPVTKVEPRPVQKTAASVAAMMVEPKVSVVSNAQTETVTQKSFSSTVSYAELAQTPIPTREAILLSEATSQALNSFIQEHSWLAKITGLFSSEALSSFGVFSLLNWADATKAMSLLKQYQVAEFVFYQERGRLADMKELNADPMGALEKSLVDAWDAQAKPVPLQGYLFSDLLKDERGQPLDREKRAGLCAYPTEPAASRPVLCMLLDVQTDEMWNFYRADSQKVGAVRRWPDAYEFQTAFVKLKKRSPQEALAEAKDLAAKAGAAVYPRPEMAEKAQRAREQGEREVFEMGVKSKLLRAKLMAELFDHEHQRLPTPVEGLKEFTKQSDSELKESDLRDPWGTPFHYTRRRKSAGAIGAEVIEAYSAGPDRQPGTPDDIYPEVDLPLSSPR